MTVRPLKTFSRIEQDYEFIHYEFILSGQY